MKIKSFIHSVQIVSCRLKILVHIICAMPYLIKKHWIILIILFVAGILRFVSVAVPDVVTDEALYGFRSIGYLDYLASDNQTTPVDWFGVDERPFWTKLSFHDHPPLVFLIQYLFFSVFGVSTLILRLPFVLAGIGSVFLVYLLGKHQFSKYVGWIAAAFLAVDPYHVWTSRTGYLESVVIFFMLLSMYFFVRMLEYRNNSSVKWGISTGLAFISKYTTAFLLPVYAVHLAWIERSWFKKKKFYIGLGFLGLVILPVVIYNIALFRYTGHFDLQFASLFGQETPEWSVISRSVGFSLTNVFSILFSLNGAIYGALAYVSILLGIFVYVRTKLCSYGLLLLTIAMLFVQFMFLGTGDRFLSLFQPWLALISACAFVWLYKRVGTDNLVRKIVIFLGGIIIVVQMVVSINTHILQKPFSVDTILYRPMHNNDFGFESLDQTVKNIIAETNMEGTLVNPELRNAVFVFDSDINYFARMWYIQRYINYYLVPFTSTNELAKYASQEGGGLTFYTGQGYNEFYFIKAESGTLLVPENVRSPQSMQLEESLTMQGVTPFMEIFNRSGEKAFTIYKFTSS